MNIKELLQQYEDNTPISSKSNKFIGVGILLGLKEIADAIRFSAPERKKCDYDKYK